MKHRMFDYGSTQALQNGLQTLEQKIPYAQDIKILGTPVRIGDKIVPNRLTAQPIEGFDALADGSPSARNVERYRRYVQGMSGMIWIESVSVNREGRSNPYQLWFTDQNAAHFAQLKQAIDEAGKQQGMLPYTVIQLTHSGRYSGPDGVPAPVCAFHNPYIPKENARIITDDELEALEDAYVLAALLAEQAGFDAVDIRACHGYIINELLGAYEREGRYGGSFENRVRFLLDVVEKVRARSKIAVAVRLNVYDGVPYPYGWGCDPKTGAPALAEPLRLVRLLAERGVCLLNISSGIGAYSPQVIRPSDGGGEQMKKEHPLEGIARMLNLTYQIKQEVPNIAVVASAFTWLREFAANVAAGGVEDGWFDFSGFGRQAIAYPDYAKDILLGGGMKRAKCCTTCNGCMALIKKKGQPMRCVVKERE